MGALEDRTKDVDVAKKEKETEDVKVAEESEKAKELVTKLADARKIQADLQKIVKAAQTASGKADRENKAANKVYWDKTSKHNAASNAHEKEHKRLLGAQNRQEWGAGDPL